MTTCTSAISSSKLDNLASRLSSVSIYSIKYVGEATFKRVSLPIHLTMRKTFFVTNSSTHLTNSTQLLGRGSKLWETRQKNWPLVMAVSYVLAHHCVHQLSSIFMSLNSGKSVPNTL